MEKQKEAFHSKKLYLTSSRQQKVLLRSLFESVSKLNHNKITTDYLVDRVRSQLVSGFETLAQRVYADVEKGLTSGELKLLRLYWACT